MLNRTFRVLILTCALLGGVASALPSHAPRSAAAVLAADVPRQETASAQIAFAAKLRKSMDGKLGAERDAIRTQAVDAYRAVRVLWPEDPDAGAEGAFRAGELLRAAKANAEAAQEFEIAREKGSLEGFGSRARLELAHLLRRTKQLERALAEFEALAALARAPQDRRDEAGLFAGKVQHELGLRAQACRTWQRLAEQAADPLDRIQAWDWLVQDLIDAKDLDGAAGMLERAREALAPIAAEETKLGERVRNAMQRMRAIDELQRAIEKRARPSEASSSSM